MDTTGLIIALCVHSADIQDRDGAKLVMERLDMKRLRRLIKIWADAGYAGKLVEWAASVFRLDLDIVRKDPDVKGFALIKKRWVVERTFGWFNRFRRLSKDYEEYPESEECMIYLAMTHLMIRRLGRT